MYLETILVLSQERKRVRAVDVGEHMGYSKPSVSRALGLLRQAGLLSVEEDGSLLLTETGRSHAEKIYERHRLLTAMLVDLGVDASTASEDACRIEHVISDESFRAIKEHYEKQ